MRALACTRGPARAEHLDGVALTRRRPALVLSNTPLDPGLPGAARAAIRAWRPDVVWAHTPVPFAAESAAWAAGREGVPLVVTYHAGALRGGTPGMALAAALHRRAGEAWMLRRAARLVAVGPYVRDRALGRHRGRVAILPPGVDAGRFRPGGQAHPATVLFVGPLDRAYRWKGLDTLWAAFPRVVRQMPGARLELVGDGDRRAELEALARADGLAGRVVFHGRLAPEELVRAYQRATVLALPSVTDAESFGMALAEANACGRPVVGSRVGGIPDFVRHGDNGLLAEPGHAPSLADALAEVLLDPVAAERMGRAGRARVLAEHAWEPLAERMEGLLAEAVAGRRTARRVRAEAPGTAG